jgi:hypothetical protein
LSPPPNGSIQHAFDEARFGPTRTLNLRATLPSGDEAVKRADAWLRERQVTAPGEDVLVITGRGRGSADGVPVIREAVLRLFPVLRRAGVIAQVQEHTAGAFIVRLATLRALVEAPRRNRRRTPPPVPRDPAVLQGLDPDTRAALRHLAQLALEALGISPRTPSFVADEMVRQFTRLVENIPDGAKRDDMLRSAIDAALEEYQ